ncbi:M42 family metallopeptidase [Mechercharimyces sp. CAU 1602]|uniref:M42 family metallopeptidase n=1 Tax=Mechercharimyces sp. CAU 1602 TaxID=2973933 RepID=UPI00216204EA|nr:M42 family metallopeptidase [Mechercharimyces sp. CAU 1602]MCS1350501.1 M42 family metallopeptidase [Mechercharimyces sp. CAU 1602]
MDFLLKELTEAKGVPGYEEEVRRIVQRELGNMDAEVVTDHMGSIFGKKIGAEEGPTICIAGHLDEVGFMVSEISRSGHLRFVPLGGWWSQVLLSQRVTIMTENKNYTGVVGSKPPHILTPEERNKVYPLKEMYIDVGAKSKEQVEEWGIHIGDPIVPICPFEILADEDTLLGKAFDNRAGCYLALESLKELRAHSHPNVVYSGATVQEEVGLRGATTAPYAVDPDVAIILDVGVAEDGPGTEGSDKLRLGNGPLVTFLDATMIPNTRFRNFVIETASKHEIPYQVETMTGGGTDAGRIHMYKRGVPSIVLGVAARYIHSHVSMVSKKDLEWAKRLVVELIKGLDQRKVDEFTQFAGRK